MIGDFADVVGFHVSYPQTFQPLIQLQKFQPALALTIGRDLRLVVVGSLTNTSILNYKTVSAYVPLNFSPFVRFNPPIRLACLFESLRFKPRYAQFVIVVAFAGCFEEHYITVNHVPNKHTISPPTHHVNN
ncbi:hypothetical protein phiP47_003 [Plesiomonas phage phiP4-7]|nr:hypothetical protein phiP47_003 [Plesiomonas phage phiP4-7]